MDVKQRQLASTEQEIVLRGLAQAAARPGCKFLEVGSWCGDSTVVLAKVAQEHGGHLFCVDWWKGSAGTDLTEIARQEDVFGLFWERICREGLEDVVVPLRGRSDVISQVLRPDTFNLVFLDGDHRYEAIMRDIASYALLVSRDGGTLCGHDCEGRLADYDAEFLEAGREVDCHESVHCGVVSAVGAAFADCSLNHSIWSVRAAGPEGGWAAANLSFPEITDRRQAPVPAIAVAKSHSLLRYGRRVYVVPHSFAEFDVTDEEQRNHFAIFSAATRREAEEFVAQAEAPPPPVPALLQEGHLGFNIVAYDGRVYAIAQDLGSIDITQLTPADVVELERQAKLFVAGSHREARLQLEDFLAQAEAPPPPILVEEGFLGFNIVTYKGRFYGVAQDVGPIDITRLSADASADLERQSKFFVADSHRGARAQAAVVCPV